MILFFSLIVWRVSHALVKERGPLDVFSRLRAMLAMRQKRMGGLFDMVSCVACVSVYIAAVTALWLAGDVLTWIWYTLALSAIATFLEQIYQKLKES